MQKMEAILGIRPDKRRAAYGERLAKRMRKRLWNASDGFFHDRDPKTGRLSPIRASTGLLPLWAGVATKEQAKKCVRHLFNKKEFWTKMPLPSVAKSESSFNRDYWRGSVWINCNVMTVMGLLRYGFRREARTLARRTVAAIARWHEKTGCIYECYDPFDALRPDRLPDRSSRLGARYTEFSTVIRNYGWSCAALVQLVDFLATGSI
jgi:neutral trehalase